MNTPNNAAALTYMGRQLTAQEAVTMFANQEATIRSLRDELAALRATLAQPDASWEPSSNDDYDRSIHSNPDASDWADFFVQTFPGQAAHRDLMLGWFANAMMAMHDHLKTKPDALTSQPSGEAVDREEVLRDYVADYEFLGETEDGRDACYQPNERERLLIEDAIRGWIAFDLPSDHPSADAPGVAVVTDEMVERAAKAYCKWFVCGSNGVNTLALRAALTAALAPKPEGE